MLSWSFRDTFTNPEQMRLVVSRVLDDARKNLPVQEDTWYDIKLILHELCCNAMEYGQYPIEVFSATCDEHMLQIIVTDSGGGFTPEIKKEVDPLSENGRGLMIVNSLAKDIQFNSAANKIMVRIQI